MRYDLLTNKTLKAIVKGRFVLFLFRLTFVILFIGLIYAGLTGSIFRNAASALTGLVWLMAISLAVPLAGKIWCTVCPWNTLADWLQLKLSAVTGRFPDAAAHQKFPFSLGLSLPAWLSRTAWLAIGFLGGLVFLEYSVGITHNPRLAAYVAVTMLALALVFALLFRRKSFCRYVCPVGIMSGLYALFAPLELRRRDKAVCDRCPTRDCARGNTHGIGCPVFEFPAEMSTNSHCILCTECLKTCPYDNLGINLRPFGSDLQQKMVLNRPNSGEIFLIILLILFITFHGLYTSPLFGAQFNTLMMGQLGVGQTGLAGFFVAGLFLLAAGVFTLSSLTFHLSSFIYALLPLQLFTHLGLAFKQLSQNGGEVLAALNDPLGQGGNLWGGGAVGGQWLSTETMWTIQMVLMGLGVVFSGYLLISGSSGQRRKMALGLVGLLGLTVLNLWLTRPA